MGLVTGIARRIMSPARRAGGALKTKLRAAVQKHGASVLDPIFAARVEALVREQLAIAASAPVALSSRKGPPTVGYRLFAGTKNVPLAQKVAGLLGKKIVPVSYDFHPDGEPHVVRGKSLQEKIPVMIQGCTFEKGGPVEALAEIAWFGDTIVGAKDFTLVWPYLPFVRGDREETVGEAVSLPVAVKILARVAGVKRLITFDMHTAAAESALRAGDIRPIHIPANRLFQRYLKDLGREGPEVFDYENAMFVSTDAGGEKMVLKLARLVHGKKKAPAMKIIAIKTRASDYEIDTIMLVGAAAMREMIEGKDIVLRDDEMSTGRTMLAVVDAIVPYNPRSVRVISTHGKFAGDASEKLAEYVKQGKITEVVVTDSVHIPTEKRFAGLTIISLAPIIAKMLDWMHANKRVHLNLPAYVGRMRMDVTHC